MKLTSRNKWVFLRKPSSPRESGFPRTDSGLSQADFPEERTKRLAVKPVSSRKQYCWSGSVEINGCCYGSKMGVATAAGSVVGR